MRRPEQIIEVAIARELAARLVRLPPGSRLSIWLEQDLPQLYGKGPHLIGKAQVLSTTVPRV